MTKPELQRKYLLQPESRVVQAILQSAFVHNHFPEPFGETADERNAAKRLYDAYCQELRNYQPAKVCN